MAAALAFFAANSTKTDQLSKVTAFIDFDAGELQGINNIRGPN